MLYFSKKSKERLHKHADWIISHSNLNTSYDVRSSPSEQNFLTIQ